MDNNSNWRPPPPPPPQGESNNRQASDSSSPDWRAQFPADSRHRVVTRIINALKPHPSATENLDNIKEVAVRFEEKVYRVATTQEDYLRRISSKLMTMVTRSQNTGVANSLQPNPVVSNQNSTDTASHGMQSQVHNHGEPHVSLANQSQAHQQQLPQNFLDTSGSGGIRSSGNLSPVIPSVTGLTPSTMSMAQNSVGQGVPSNIYSNPQRQMQGRQHQQLVVSQQNQQLPSNTHQYMYQQHQNQILKQKLQQGNMQSSRMQSQIQPQQNLLQSSQQSLMHVSSSIQSSHSTSQQTQSSGMQSASITGFQQNQQSPAQPSPSTVLQPHAQSILRQQPQPQQSLHQQSTGLHQQQASVPQQQQQMLVGQQQSTTNIQQQNQLLGQQHSILDLQQSQQLSKQRLLGQQNSLSNVQQQQQQLLGQQNNISNLNQHQLGSQSGVGLQHQQLVSGQSLHMLSQQAKAVGQQQQIPQTSLTMMQIPGQQSQSQPRQQQLLSQLQTQPTHFQQQLGLQHQLNPIQRDIQQRHNSSGVPAQNVIEQKQIQSQWMLAEVSSTSMDSTSQAGHANTADFQEEVYQKIKAMKEMYFKDLNEIHQRISLRLEQHDSNPRFPKEHVEKVKEQLEKLRLMRVSVENMLLFLQVSKSDITPFHRDRFPTCEKQIVDYVNANRSKRPNPSNQGQQKLQSPGGTLSMTQQQQPQSQIPKLQQIDNHMQSMNTPNNVASVQPSTRTSMSHGSLPLSAHMGVLPTQTNAMNLLQSNSTLEMAQGSVPSLLQQGAMGSRQQNTLSAPQHGNMNTLSQSGANMTSLQLTSNMFQQQHTKQQPEQLLQSQQYKHQLHQRQMQFINQQQKQQLQQQQMQQKKQQQSAQFHAHQMPQLQQMSEDLKMRQSITLKAGMAPQQHSPGQRMPYHHQQLRPGAQFPISSQFLPAAASPQTSQQSSPQIDQQNLITSFPKAGTPLQSANSPFIVPSPSTPLAPSPIPGDPDKQVSSVSSLQNAGIDQTSMTPTQAQSLAIGTPGISASPLLAEFISTDGNQVTEQPLERLMKVVKSSSPKAFSAAINDMGSIISMTDRMAGSTPGIGSRAVVGEDLMAMTKSCVQTRDFVTRDMASTAKKMKRDTTAMPVITVSLAGSINDSVNQSASLEMTDLESTATSRIRRPNFEANHALLEEIKEINQRLIDTVIEIDEGIDPAIVAGKGTVVKCSYAAVALNPNLKKEYASGQMSQILPLQLLIPTNYPNCSPVLLDYVPANLSMDCDDMSLKARLRFSMSLRCLSQPMSLKEMVRTWDACTRAVITEYAKQRGGGTFSSRYGTWEKCVVAT